jgi:hypothetical protein
MENEKEDKASLHEKFMVAVAIVTMTFIFIKILFL